jgi:hypothetical protein
MALWRASLVAILLVAFSLTLGTDALATPPRPTPPCLPYAGC